MGKNILIIAVLTALTIFVSCSMKGSIGEVVISDTPTPNITIRAYVDRNMDDATTNTSVEVTVDSWYYRYATVTVNSIPLIYDGSWGYVESGAIVGYAPGMTYTAIVKTGFGDFTASNIAPGGNINLSGFIINYDYGGSNDSVRVINMSTVCPEFFSLISPGYNSVVAFTAPGSYRLEVNAANFLADVFSGPVIPSESSFSARDYKTLYASW
jgi:hypothetical protein